MKRLYWVLNWTGGLTALACAFLAGVYVARPTGTGENRRAVPEQPTSMTIHALGRLQPVGGLIQLLATPGDRVEKVHVVRGQRVKPDQQLITLASQRGYELEEKLALSRLQEARAQEAAVRTASEARLKELDTQLQELEATRQVEEETQAVKIGALEKQVEVVRLQRSRLAALEGTRAQVSAQERETQELALTQAEAELRAARLVLTRTKRVFIEKTESARGARQTAEAERELNIKRIPLASLEAALELATQRRRAGEMHARVEATVLQVEAQPGIVADTRPLIQLAAGSGLAVVAEVYETDITRLLDGLRKGPIPVKVTSRALSQPLRGQLSSKEAIARIIGRNTLFSPSPRADLDRRVVEVRVHLDGSFAGHQATELIGLDVDVRFETRE